jgi:hypothetical protein
MQAHKILRITILQLYMFGASAGNYEEDHNIRENGVILSSCTHMLVIRWYKLRIGTEDDSNEQHRNVRRSHHYFGILVYT